MFRGLFGKKRKKRVNIDFSKLPTLTVDMHSHLLPGIDDGAQTLEESVEMIRRFADMGYKQLVTTPHVMSDFYRNSSETILQKRDEVREALIKENIDVELDAAAEYYLDEGLIEKLKNHEKLLTIGDNYLLFETSYMNASANLSQAVFMMQSQGYKPVMAHPERYTYWFGKNDEIREVWEKGVHMQVNLMSLVGYYSKASKDIAEWLIDEEMVSFVATDCHRSKHQDVLDKVRRSEYYAKALQLPLKNFDMEKKVAAA